MDDEYETLLWRTKQDLEREMREEDEAKDAWERQRRRVIEAKKVVDGIQESRLEAILQLLKRVDEKLERVVVVVASKSQSSSVNNELQAEEENNTYDEIRNLRKIDSGDNQGNNNVSEEAQIAPPSDSYFAVRAIRSNPHLITKKSKLTKQEASSSGSEEEAEDAAQLHEVFDSSKEILGVVVEAEEEEEEV